MAKRAYRGKGPPTQVVMLGCSIPWAEAPQSRSSNGRRECPNGCGRRDLGRERRLGLDRVCLRCLLHTADHPDWRLAAPLAARRPVAPPPKAAPPEKLTRRERRARQYGAGRREPIACRTGP